MRWPPFIVLLLAAPLLAGGAAMARDSVVIYRCTDASGALTIQNDVPCPAGSRQDRRVIANVAPASPSPAPTVPRPVATLPAKPPATPVAPIPGTDRERLPPPLLFECRTFDDSRYLNDDGTPPERCAPLPTTGLAGNAAIAAGSACQMVTDQCQRIPDEALCASWKQRLNEAESSLLFGRADNRPAAQAEVERIGRITRESTCGG